VALELATARSDQQRVVLLEDRDRIARDLHDHVIQQLFAIGLSLESVATMVASNQTAAERLHAGVADLDRTIRQIRTSIFELRGPIVGSGEFRQRVLAIAGELTPALGFSPRVAFAGPVDSLIAGTLADDVLACVREALTNIAKHARASSADVDVTAHAGEVTVTISDNGIGIGSSVSTSGLKNLRARAERRGGSFDVQLSAHGGAQLTWKAPIT
jgi:signal transduction histidine kinase